MPASLPSTRILDDLPGALTTGSRLQSYLESVAKWQLLPRPCPRPCPGRAFLNLNGSGDYAQLLEGQISEAKYVAREQLTCDWRIAEAVLAPLDVRCTGRGGRN